MNTDASKLWVGADPGGECNFGLAVLRPDSTVKTWCVDHADEAVEVLRSELSGPPLGMGVDAPLWWSSGRAGVRKADEWLREKYDLPSRNVQASNSMWGAVLVQGAMFVHRVRELFGAVPVTESHPKALLAALKIKNWDDCCKSFALSGNDLWAREHQRDAVIAAVCAREGFEGRWTNDLVQYRYPCELDPTSHWLAPVHYYWPEK